MSRFTFLLIAAALAVWVAGARAEEPQGGEGRPGAGAAATASPYANWWQKSSLSYAPVPRRLLTHFEGTISYMNASGNTQGTAFDAGSGVSLRLWRFTNRFSLSFNHKDLDYGTGGGAVDYRERALRNHFEYDLTKHSVLVGGFDDYANTLMFIDSRTTKYAGAGWTLLDSDKHRLTIIGGLGHTDFDFDKEAMEQINPTAIAALPRNPTSGGSVLMQAYTWHVSPRLTLSQDASYTEYFTSNLGDLATFNVSLNVPVSRRISITTGYRFKEEDNAYIRALGVKTQDKSFTTGFRISI